MVFTLKLKVMPGASRTEVAGWLGDVLKVRVSAQPEKGRANAAVEALLAKELDLPSDSTKIVAGKRSQQKLMEIRGLSKSEALQKLGPGKSGWTGSTAHPLQETEL